MEAAEILLEEDSPRCPITAVVEQDDRTVYFYLFSKDEKLSFGVKSCWIRNLKKAPEAPDIEAQKKGLAPLLSAEFCRFPEGQEKFSADDLGIIWFEEGDGAALVEDKNLLAIIPSWSGQQGFSGYSRDCIGKSSVCWEIGDFNYDKWVDRINGNLDVWEAWEEEDHWKNFLRQSLKMLEAQFGEYEKYYGIGGEEWPPKALVTFQEHSRKILVTLGVSLSPQPSIENENFNRIELGIVLNESFTDEEVMAFASLISSLSQYPWDHITWLGEGHTIPCNLSKIPRIGNFKSVLLTENYEDAPEIDFSPINHKKTKTLWLIPITEREKNYAAENSSEGLKEKLRAAGVSAEVKSRECVFSRS